MNFWKIKIRPSDKLWTTFIRLRDKNKCFWCGSIILNLYNSGVSHYWGRSNESVRYEDCNSDLMHNIPCHSDAEHQKQRAGEKDFKEDGEYTKRKKKQLGEKRFNSLMLQKYTFKDKDEELDKIIIKEKLKRLNEET